jgi:EmrB/QacA subfamily drug resistance transporter
MAARRQRLTLIAVILGTIVVGVDSTIVSLALPAIRDDLGGGLAGQQWVVNAYLLTLGSLVLVGGALADLLGERRVFATGLVGFGAASLACALAPGIGALIAARAVQGVFAALLIPATLGVLASVFGEAERGRAIGTWTAWGSASLLLGPLLGGLIVDAASWRWVFAVNLPVVALTVALTLLVVPATAPAGQRHLDTIGALLAASGLAGVVFALIEQPNRGWSGVAAPLALGAVLLGAFVLWERRTTAPMLPLALFARRNFVAANVQTLAVYGGIGVLSFFLVVFLQQVAGYGALQAGLVMVPTTLVLMGLGKPLGALADRRGARLNLTVGPLLAGAGLLWLTRIDATPSYVVDVLPGVLLFGLGLAFTVAPITAMALADADEHNAGIASATNSAIARVSGLVAVAAVGAAVAVHYAAVVDARLETAGVSQPARAAIAAAREAPLAPVSASALPRPDGQRLADATVAASVSAFRLSMGVAGGLILLGAALGAVGFRPPRRTVRAEHVPGGQLAGSHPDAFPDRPPAPPSLPAPTPPGSRTPVGSSGAV